MHKINFEDLIGIHQDINIKPAEKALSEFLVDSVKYESALKILNTRIEVLKDEFQRIHDYNPIEHVKLRVKSPKSIIAKLVRRGLAIDTIEAYQTLTDIAGIRLICSFIDDIYLVRDALSKQEDIDIIEVKDYISNPKPSGYRSMHLIVEVPVHFSNHLEKVKVEVQIRTMAMDFWASLEHKLHYKNKCPNTSILFDELKVCSEHINDLDIEMMTLHKKINEIG